MIQILIWTVSWQTTFDDVDVSHHNLVCGLIWSFVNTRWFVHNAKDVMLLTIGCQKVCTRNGSILVWHDQCRTSIVTIPLFFIYKLIRHYDLRYYLEYSIWQTAIIAKSWLAKILSYDICHPGIWPSTGILVDDPFLITITTHDDSVK